MRVADAALLVVSAVDGLQVGTELAWRMSEERNLAKLILINKMDRENADFGRVIEQLRERYGKRVALWRCRSAVNTTFTA
jgi:elongation factor G